MTEYLVKGIVYIFKTIKVLTHRERFAVGSSVNGLTSKESMDDRVVSPCFTVHRRRHSKTLSVCLGLKATDISKTVFIEFPWSAKIK